MRSTSRIFVAPLVALTAAAFLFGAYKPSTCADFLTQLNKKPANLEFVGCKQEDSPEDTLLVATYRVPGAHAAEVESFLVQDFKLKRLVKSCCQWDGPAVGYVHNGKTFEIAMQSEEDSAESASTSRAGWRKTPFFHVRVSLHEPKAFSK